MVLKFRFAPVVAALALLSACGGGGDLETETSTPYSPSAGMVVDGYLSIAKVVCDTNGNGVADNGEPVTYTNTLGNYVFPSGCAFGVLASGGTNIETNSAFLGQLRAPAGATVVTPLTTLVAAGMTQDQVISALSLPKDTKLLTTDPAATDKDGLINSSLYKKTLAVQHIAEKITNLFTTLSAQSGYVSSSAATADVYGEVAKAMATQIRAGDSLIAGDGLVSATVVSNMVAASVNRMSQSAMVSQEFSKVIAAAGGSTTLSTLVSDAFANQAGRFLTANDTNLSAVATALSDNKVVENNLATAFRAGSLDSKTTSAAITALKENIALKKQDPLFVSADQSRLDTYGTTDLTAIGGSGTGVLGFKVTSGSCSVSGKTLTSFASEGTCTVVATRAADENFEQTTSESQTISVYLRAQDTLVANAAQSNLYTTGRTTLSTKGGSGSGSVTYAVDSGGCTVNGSTLIAPTTTGTCTVVAIKAGDSFYSQKSAKPITIGISNESQNALLASAAQTALALDGKTTLSATGGSGGGAVTFQITSGDCTLNGSSLSAPAAEGTCTVVATKAAEATYAQATSGPITINIVLKTQSPLTLSVDQAGLYTAGKATLSVLGGSGTGTVSYAVTSGSCTLGGSTLTAPSTAGTCTVVATKAGDGSYGQVTSQPLTISISLRTPDTLVIASTKTGLLINDQTTLSSSGGSGSGAVSYAVASGSCVISGATLTAPPAAGTCTVVATKAADASYVEVRSQPITFTIALRPQATLVLSAANSSLFVNGQTTVSTSGGSGSGAVTYAISSGSCTLTGATLSASASTGTCTVVATKAADGTYAGVSSLPVTVTIAQRPQDALAIAATSSSIFVTGQTTLSASGGSGSGAVNYTVTSGSGSCSISGSTLTASSLAGTCSVVANKAGDTSYVAVISQPLTITVQAAQVLSSTSPIDFEPAGRGAVFAWTTFENDTGPWTQIVANPSKTGINTSDKAVMFKAISSGNPWAGFQSAHKTDLGTVTFNADNALVKMMVYKSVISDVGVKFANAADVSTGEVKVANTKTNEWEQLTFNFCGRVGEVNDQIILFPDFNLAGRTSDTTSYLDNISFNACPATTVPTTEPAFPTALAAKVISLYGDGYTTVKGTDTPKWGGMTTTITAQTYAGNNVLKLASFNYQGFTNSAPLDISKHTSLHIDFWSQTATTIEVKLVSLSPTTLQESIFIPVSAGVWTSKDIPLSSFTKPDKTKFQQLVIAAANVGQTLYVDNVYFWK